MSISLTFSNLSPTQAMALLNANASVNDCGMAVTPTTEIDDNPSTTGPENLGGTEEMAEKRREAQERKANFEKKLAEKEQAKAVEEEFIEDDFALEEEEEEEEEEPCMTLEELTAKVKILYAADAKSFGEVRRAFNVTKLSELAPEQYQEFVDKCNQKLAALKPAEPAESLFPDGEETPNPKNIDPPMLIGLGKKLREENKPQYVQLMKKHDCASGKSYKNKTAQQRAAIYADFTAALAQLAD